MKPATGTVMIVALPLFLAQGLKHGFLEFYEQWHAAMSELKAILDDEADQ